MNDPMTILKADHREVKKILTTLADSDEGSAREKLTVEVDHALRLHMEIEENILYPLVAKEVGADAAAVVKRSRAVSGRLNTGVGGLLKKNKVTIIWGEAKISKPGEIVVSSTVRDRAAFERAAMVWTLRTGGGHSRASVRHA